VHHEVKRKAADGFDIIYVGHVGHDEAVGTVAEAPDVVTLIDPTDGLGSFTPADPAKVALVAQTTLGMYEWEDVLGDAQHRYPELWTSRKSDLCYATTNRQEAIVALSERSDVVLVVGSATSSNTNALVRVAASTGTPAYRVDGPGAVDPAWIADANVVGVTAGASAPDQAVRAVIEKVAPIDRVEELRIADEDEYFPLPPSLRSFLSALQSVVEAGYGAPHADTGPLDNDRMWTATAALELLGAGSGV
jgi:4-hydroxy-3-methylbut-2-enyl diphosphate reductase